MAKSLQVSDVGSVVRLYREEIDAAIRRVVDSGWFILGPEVEALESAFARMTGTRHGIAVASGTDAVELALRAAGVVPGDAVITVSHTASASAAAIERSGATPWFVDIDRDRFTMDPGALDTVLTQSTKAAEKLKVGAVLPVHLYGIPADMAPIRQIARIPWHSGSGGCSSGSRSRARRSPGRIPGLCWCVQLLPHEEPGRTRRWRHGRDQRRTYLRCRPLVPPIWVADPFRQRARRHEFPA